MTKILLIDDDAELCDMLIEYLEADGFDAVAVHDGSAGISAIRRKHFDLAILDIMMPIKSGIQTLREIRQSSLLPVIMLTARGDEIDRVLGLELGADDYVAKPCSPRELVARIRAVLRRTEHMPGSSTPLQAIVLGDLNIDSGNRKAQWNNRNLKLTSTEFNILAILVANHGKVVNKARLYEEALHRAQDRYDRSIDVHISSLRKKLGTLADGRSPIETIRGLGYQYVDDKK